MKVHVTFCIHQKCDTFTVTIPGSLMKRCVSILRKKKRKYIDLQSSLSTIDTLISLAAFHTVINCHTKEEYMHEDTKSGCSLGTGNRRILPLLCRILRLWHKESNNWEVLNYCLIVAKYNVFATNVQNGVLDFDSFLLRVNNKIDILRTIAFRFNRLSQFKKTWDKLL